MYREIVEQLTLWKNQIDRKPILLTGAKGVGKTEVAMQFADKNYKKKIVFHVDKKESGFLFYENLSRKKFDEAINNYIGPIEHKEDILLIFDHVMEEQYGINSVEDVLRFIVGVLRDYDICVLTNFEENKVFSKALLEQMDVYHLHSISIKEFFIINGDEALYEAIRGQMECDLSDEQKEKAKKYLRVYMMTGGMPQVINTYMETRSLEKVRESRLQVYKDALAYIEKVASPAIKKQAVEIFESIGTQLNRPYKVFCYREFGLFVNKALYEGAIEWLQKHQLVIKVEHIEKSTNKSFKLYYADLSYLSQACGAEFEKIWEVQSVYELNFGSLVEQMSLQQLLLDKNNCDITYWSGKEKCEIEFILTRGEEHMPVQMGFGLVNRTFSKEYYKKYKSEFVIRVTECELKVGEGEIQIPLYSLWNL